MKATARKTQTGIATVEFAIVSTAFFLIVLDALEVSRLLFTWNTLDAMTQRAARVAAVCPPNHSAVKQVGMFGTPGNPANLLIGFTEANLQIDYLSDTFSNTAGSLTSSFVRAQVVGYQIQLIPFVSSIAITSPAFTSVVPRESLGFIPDTQSFTCFGSSA